MKATALFALFIGAFAQDPFQVYNIPSQLAITGSSSSAICDPPTLRGCQDTFNNALNLTSDLDWSDPYTLSSELSSYYIAGINGFLKVCQVRQIFQACLGDMYNACMSVTRFVRDGEDYYNAMTYVQMFNEIEFDCNGGFVQVTQNYSCILDVWTRSQDYLMGCVSQFNKTIALDPSQYCSAVIAAEECTRKPFQDSCGPEASWWQCERTRVGGGLDQLCPTNYCGVQQSTHATLLQKMSRKEQLQYILQGSDAKNRVMAKFAEKARLRQKNAASLQ